MAASVRIEDEAFSDTRIELLGSILGTTKYDALGRLAHLWKQATQMGKDVLPTELVALHIDPDSLVRAGLGVPQNGNRVRIKGARGRIEWLERKREAGRRNGHLGAEFGKLGGRPTRTLSKPGEGVTKNPPPAPAPALNTNGQSGSSFDDFWNAWPKKVAKAVAVRAWVKLSPGPEMFAAILADVARRKASPDWKKDDGRFIPHPASYLNGRRWEDETGFSGNVADPAAASKEATQKMLREHAEKLKRIQDEQRAADAAN